MSIERPDNVDVFETRDGSRTLVDRDREAHYSSTHGAEDESRHIYIRGTRVIERPSPWRVLELGFGAGVNFVQTARAARERGYALDYHAVEYAPVDPDLVTFHDGEPGDLVRRALEAIDLETPSPVEVTDSTGDIGLVLHPVEWCSLDLEDFEADAVYFDPFGPRKEPDSWRTACFHVAREHMQSDAVLGTYSAATRVKRAMFHAGLAVASAPGPGPKREITFASPSREPLASYELLSDDDYLDS